MPYYYSLTQCRISTRTTDLLASLWMKQHNKTTISQLAFTAPLSLTGHHIWTYQKKDLNLRKFYIKFKKGRKKNVGPQHQEYLSRWQIMSFLVHLCISKVTSHFLKIALGHRVDVLNCWQPFGQNLKWSAQGVLLTWQDSCVCVYYMTARNYSSVFLGFY